MKHFLLLFLFSSAILASAQPKALFYMTGGPNSVASFTEHAAQVDILVPAWYSVDGNGLVWGGPNPSVLKTAAEHHVPVMPIVASAAQAELHKLFTTAPARSSFIASLLSECQKYGYSGFQIDFENVNWTDRDSLSSLVADAATTLHKEKLQLTIATVPNAPGSAGLSSYSHWLFANWRGAYDLKALAQSADLICLMTYDQNTALDPARSGRGLSLDGRKSGLCSAIRPQRKTVAGNSPVWVSLVRRRSRQRRKAESDCGIYRPTRHRPISGRVPPPRGVGLRRSHCLVLLLQR
jgi:hypothetical protein